MNQFLDFLNQILRETEKLSSSVPIGVPQFGQKFMTFEISFPHLLQKGIVLSPKLTPLISLFILFVSSVMGKLKRYSAFQDSAKDWVSLTGLRFIWLLLRGMMTSQYTPTNTTQHNCLKFA